jgi:hypothetical protein
MDYSGQEYGPFDTSVEYFKDTARRIRLAHKSSQWASDEPVNSQFTCWLYDQLSPHLDAYNTGPFPLMHPDLCGNQLLLTDDKLNGVIDWDGVGTVPWLLFSTFPATLKIPWPRVECGTFSQSIVVGIQDQQRMYVEALRRLEEQGSSAASRIVDLLDTESINVADILVYFSDPYYEYPGHRVYEYLFPELKQSLEEFRSQDSWK